MRNVTIELTVTGDDMASTVIEFCEILCDHIEKRHNEQLPYVMADLSGFDKTKILDAYVTKNEFNPIIPDSIITKR